MPQSIPNEYVPSPDDVVVPFRLRAVRDEDSPPYDGAKSSPARQPMCMMPSAVVREFGPKIGAIPLAVYAVLAEHANGDGRCWPSYKTIGAMVNISRRQAIRAVQVLADHGLVEVEYRRDDATMRSQSNVFRLPKCVVPSDGASLPLVNHGHYPSEPRSLPSDAPSPRTIPNEPNPNKQNHDPLNPPNEDSAPKPAKPRTPKQQASDALYERRSALYAAYCRGVGIPPDSFAWRQGERRAFADLKRVDRESEVTPDVMERLSRYALGAYRWRAGKRIPSVAEALAAFAEWDAAGQPDEPPRGDNGRPKTAADWNKGGTGRLVTAG